MVSLALTVLKPSHAIDLLPSWYKNFFKGLGPICARLAGDGLGTVRARLARFTFLAGNPFESQAKRKV